MPAEIYVIDDDASIRKALERVLRGAGLRCRTFDSGAEFLRDVEPGASGCLILDLAMPEMNGHQLQASLNERGYHLPVIVLTAMDSPANRERSRELGAVSFFRKPVDNQALLDAIQWASGATPQNQ